MGIINFIVWFCAALVVTFFLEITFENPFIISFIVALAVGFLAGTRE
jgi:hypothetical protein